MKNKKFKFLLSYLKYEKSLLFFGIVFSIIVAIISAYLPIIISNVINTEFSKVENFKNFITYYAILYLSLSILSFVFTIIFRICFAKLATKLSKKIQFDVVRKMQGFEMKYFDSASSGDLSSRFTSDTDTIKGLYETTFTNIFTVFINLLSILIVIFYTNKFLFLIVVVYFPIIHFSSKFYGKKIEKIQKNIRTHEGITSSIYNETVKALPIVQVFSNENKLKEKFLKENEKVKKGYIKRAIFNAAFTYNFSRLISGFSNVLLVLSFAFLKQKGWALNVGILYLLINYNQRISHLFGMLLWEISAYRTSFVACGRILKVLETDCETSGKEKINLLGEVEFKDVYFEYKENTPVLKNINFKLDKGKSIAFVGATGSGKSTIMNLVLGFYDNQKGEILFDNKNMKLLDKKNLRKQMAIVLQEPYIFTQTVFENIKMGDERISKKDALDALIKVGGKEFLEKRKDGLDTELIENANELSLGEKQILSFARAIVRNPKILILDEATSNIDTETEKIINYGIEILKKDRSTIIIAHRLSTIKNCDLIVMIENGNIIEKGRHDELILLNGKYKHWYEIQSSKEEN